MRPLLRSRLKKAAAIVAAGGTLTEAARQLKVDRGHLTRLKRDYPQEWEKLLAAARQARTTRSRTPRKLERNPPGPGAAVRRGIAQATTAIAAGRTLHEAAQAAGASYKAMRDWQRRNPQLWCRALDNALQHQADVIRWQAGTDAVQDEPDRYFRSAALCDAWMDERGEDLFPAGGETTLATFFASYYVAHCLADARPRTLETYQSIVRQWRLLTGDPPLDKITPQLLVKFRDTIARRRGKRSGSRASANSVRKVLKHVQAILDKAGPAGPRNRDAAGVIVQAPYVKPPRPTYHVPRIVEPEMVHRVYLAAVAAERPRIAGCKPPAWWKALIVTAYNTGLRRASLFALRFEDIHFDDAYLQLAPGQMKTGVGLRLPLHPAVIEHLQAIRGQRELVFPWPHAMTHFYSCFYAIQAAAGIPAKDHFALHDLRRTAATVLWSTAPQAAQLVLGHASLRTTREHYIDGRGMLADAVAAMPQPSAFAEGGAA